MFKKKKQRVERAGGDFEKNDPSMYGFRNRGWLKSGFGCLRSPDSTPNHVEKATGYDCREVAVMR